MNCWRKDCFALLTAMCLAAAAFVWGMDSIHTGNGINGSTAVTAIEDENNRQLRIYGDALLHGLRDSIRLDAAMGLLLRKDKDSQDILLQALDAQDNPPARIAVCRALIKVRGIAGSVGSTDVYLPSLIKVLKSSDSSLSRTAAEALLIYPYSSVFNAISDLIMDTSADKLTRINGIFALQVRPEPETLKELSRLLNDPDFEIVRASEFALQESFGVPVGTSKSIWTKILKDLEQKDPAEIRRERLLRQETRLREIQAEKERWQKMYLSGLDKEYELLDMTLKAGYLQDKLLSDLPAIRLWGLDKLQRFPAESALPIREKLLSCLSDDNRQVRLVTAQVLSTISVLDPAEKLLDRYKEETDPQVALAIFEALGEACFFAFSPGSKITLSAEIKTQTFQISDSYAQKEDPEMAKKGAEVLRKLLELDGITQQEALYYLKTIQGRYSIETEKKGPVRGDLLSIMARLCGQGSQKALAGQVFGNTFIDVLEAGDDNNSVRQAAAAGLINLDKIKAIKLFRTIALYKDNSPAVRQIVIELAGQAGTVDDIDWLSALLGVNGQVEPIWQSIEQILQRYDAQVTVDWLDRFKTNPLLKEQILNLLEMAEQKALAQKQNELLADLQVRLIKWNLENGLFEQVLAYRDKLTQESKESNEFAVLALKKTDSLAIEAFIGLKKYDKAGGLISTLLSSQEITENSDTIIVIEKYLNSDGIQIEDKAYLVKALVAVTVHTDVVWWKTKLAYWKELVNIIDIPVKSLK